MWLLRVGCGLPSRRTPFARLTDEERSLDDHNIRACALMLLLTLWSLRTVNNTGRLSAMSGFQIRLPDTSSSGPAQAGGLPGFAISLQA